MTERGTPAPFNARSRLISGQFGKVVLWFGSHFEIELPTQRCSRAIRCLALRSGQKSRRCLVDGRDRRPDVPNAVPVTASRARA
jgi:hypothetical protein